MDTSEKVWEDFNTLRMLVLIEGEDGYFRQVLLSPSRFKIVSDACNVPDTVLSAEEKEAKKEAEKDLKDGYTLGHLHLAPNWKINADLFLGLSDVHEDADKCDRFGEEV